MAASNYGKFHWEIVRSDGTSIRAHADAVNVQSGGALMLERHADGKNSINAVFAPGAWRECRVAVEHDPDDHQDDDHQDDEGLGGVPGDWSDDEEDDD